MENGSFQTRLAQLEFLEKSREIENFEGKSNPKSSDRIYSASALLRQNEDLSARLKIAMEKLILAEEQTENLEASNRLLSKTNESLQDQMLIWKEKERLWIEKLEKSEIKTQELESRYPEYQSLKHEIARYKKYHEKVKTQIKPYIQQLKDYSKGLLDQIKEMNRENLNQKHHINHLETKLEDLQTELSTRVTAHSLSLDEIQKLHSHEVDSLKNEIQSLKEANLVLSSRSERLDQSLARQDELENLTIELKRKVESSEIKIQSETEGLRNSLQLSRNELTKKNLQIETLESQNQMLQETVNRLELETMNVSEQLISLRYLWEEKARQIEQTKSMIQALEKVNLELSQKLNSSTKRGSLESVSFQQNY